MLEALCVLKGGVATGHRGWGWGERGQLGSFNGTQRSSSPFPVEIEGIEDAPRAARSACPWHVGWSVDRLNRGSREFPDVPHQQETCCFFLQQDDRMQQVPELPAQSEGLKVPWFWAAGS